jgi:pyridoxamine 5'-phosphate oxidase
MTNTLDTIDERTIDRDPVAQFQLWFADAVAAALPLPEAMSLSTVNAKGKPTARMVLLKNVGAEGFVFFTNYRSAKARELADNPNACLLFFWPQLERQVRIEGVVNKTSIAESREYFATRPRGSQIGAWASPQSEVIPGREVLEQRQAELEKVYLDREIPWPEHWGGYCLKPERIEFWRGRRDRLHDRILYVKQADGSWTIQRLAP